MEQRIDELRSEDHEAWQVCLESVVDVVVLAGRDFEILFELVWP